MRIWSCRGTAKSEQMPSNDSKGNHCAISWNCSFNTLVCPNKARTSTGVLRARETLIRPRQETEVSTEGQTRNLSELAKENVQCLTSLHLILHHNKLLSINLSTAQCFKIYLTFEQMPSWPWTSCAPATQHKMGLRNIHKQGLQHCL